MKIVLMFLIFFCFSCNRQQSTTKSKNENLNKMDSFTVPKVDSLYEISMDSLDRLEDSLNQEIKKKAEAIQQLNP